MSGTRSASSQIYQELDGKLDRLITGQELLVSRVGTMEEQVKELNRTVRGFNGTPGLVTEVSLLKETLNNCYITKKNEPSLEDNDAEHKQFITWRWVVDKFFVPVVVAVVVWLLLTFIPSVSATGGLP